MAKIDLYDPKWIEMVFANKNREYGAYKLRKGTTNRNLLSLAILIGAVLLLWGGLVLKSYLDDKAAEAEAEAYDASLQASILEDEKKKEEEKKDLPPPPPPEEIQVPEERATQQYTVPEIKEVIDESKQLKQQDQLDKSVETGTETKEGTNDATVLQEAVKEVEEIKEEPKPEPPKEVEDTRVYNLAELAQQPSFPGGDAAMYAWLSKNLQYPPIAQENGISGTVVVSFVIGKDGSVSDVKVVRGKDPSLDKEAVRVVSKMPKWNPGKQNGQNVRVSYTLPVKFQLQ